MLSGSHCKYSRVSCLKLEINELRCYEVKIEESEKAGSCRESNPTGVLGSTPGDCQPFHYPLFSPYNI